MGRPVGHADPTELVCEASALFDHSKRVLTSTLFARHVIATAILLNRRVALGALFRIRHQPVGRLGIVGALLFPQLDILADQWSVVAREAASGRESA
jgi:hypothetical protein